MFFFFLKFGHLSVLQAVKFSFLQNTEMESSLKRFIFSKMSFYYRIIIFLKLFKELRTNLNLITAPHARDIQLTVFFVT